jgi:hypothetical protein
MRGSCSGLMSIFVLSAIGSMGINQRLLLAMGSPSSVFKVFAGNGVVLLAMGTTWSNKKPKPSGAKLVWTLR